jgi:iron complex outermembrane recepter protein
MVRAIARVVQARQRLMLCAFMGAAAPVFATPYSGNDLLPDSNTPEHESTAGSNLETVVVTGSLLPTATGQDSAAPLIVITPEEVKSRGFGTLAETLQQTSLATGSVAGPQAQLSITPGLQTVSLFGFTPSFAKYLVDGRPIADYPHLYGGQDMVANLAGIPEELIDRIEIVPGGQSSLYGSDAIAGVVNILLKKQLSGPTVDFRYRAYDHGGGVSKRIALADSFDLGRLTVLAGAQAERKEPIWGYQRPLTASYYTAGTSPVTAERDYVVATSDANGGFGYYFPDTTNCASVSGQFGGTVREYSRPGIGTYCGTTRAGFSTLDTGSNTVEGYLHLTYALSEEVQAYADVLASHDYSKWSYGAGDWSYPYQPPFLYYDASLGTLTSLQHLFSPEEAGGLDSTLSNLTSNVYRYRVGMTGTLAHTNWSYDADVSRAQYRLIRRTHVEFTEGLDRVFSSILGPNLGPDPIYGLLPTFAPDYAAFFRPITPQQYASFTGFTNSHGSSTENLSRLQLTDASVTHLPGGKMGLALVLEYGDESWNLIPDPRLLDGEVYGISAQTGGGRRSRVAGTTEIRMPLLPVLELDASARYDDYRVLDSHVGKATYSLGLEIRPIDRLLVRGRYGTAFKAPTLGDEFQGKSYFGTNVTDYYQCALLGFSGANLGNCPYYLANVGLVGAGNPKPITADVSSAGVVWRPLTHTAVSADFLHWRVTNEVAFQSADALMREEAACRLGQYDISSPSCVAALSQVTRDVTGVVSTVFTPKVNVARETTNAVTAQIDQEMTFGRLGTLALKASWTDLLKHTRQQYPGDPVVDQFRDPINNTDFKSKENASITWNVAGWSTTVYAFRTGRSPNNLATINGYGTPGAGTLPPWAVCNFNLRYSWRDSLKFSFTVDNVFDRMPPADHTYTGDDNHPYNDANYNVYGRAYYFEVSYPSGR